MLFEWKYLTRVRRPGRGGGFPRPAPADPYEPN